VEHDLETINRQLNEFRSKQRTEEANKAKLESQLEAHQRDLSSRNKKLQALVTDTGIEELEGV